MIFMYPAMIHKDEDGLWAEFPDLPGCFSDGTSLEDVLGNASEALGGYVLTLLERGGRLPEPSSPLSLHGTDSSFVNLISADVDLARDTKSVKKTLTIPQWMDREARARHINFSGELQKALLRKLQEA